MTTPEPWKNILAAIETAILRMLAFPFTVVAAVAGLRKVLKIATRINEGKLVCAFCKTENPLNLMTRCPTCTAVEPGSRLRCTFCGATYDVIPCVGCGATLRVL
jgi:hypothetical protein